MNEEYDEDEGSRRSLPKKRIKISIQFVDVFVTLECIHPYILCSVPRCLFREVSIMYLSHIMPRCSYREILQCKQVM